MARRGEKPSKPTPESSADWNNEHDEGTLSYLGDQVVVYFKVMVAGEAGIGKTTLVATLANTLQGIWAPEVTVEFDESQRFVITFPSGVRPR
jgi:predicted ATP-dependent serine protease